MSSSAAEPPASVKPKSFRVEKKAGKEKKEERERRKMLKKEKKKLKSASNEPLIEVTVNDRLGTKAKIPCRPTDTIRDLKAFVAFRIGRQVHEILLKRQSERPFRDELTLQDYGVSNGAQIDLEVNTGD